MEGKFHCGVPYPSPGTSFWLWRWGWLATGPNIFTWLRSLSLSHMSSPSGPQEIFCIRSLWNLKKTSFRCSSLFSTHQSCFLVVAFIFYPSFLPKAPAFNLPFHAVTKGPIYQFCVLDKCSIIHQKLKLGKFMATIMVNLSVYKNPFSKSICYLSAFLYFINQNITKKGCLCLSFCWGYFFVINGDCVVRYWLVLSCRWKTRILTFHAKKIRDVYEN